ncbi:alpha/beta fold hydrolase [Streptomyces blattellae]|uniref:alpha/beta fold hydrolase n=1 Tax=Streptomyces blattellae TaxID=2569855 RepID=UPI0012B922D0|nr:alpha/beta hydrolase [Streptomyces blattellae]
MPGTHVKTLTTPDGTHIAYRDHSPLPGSRAQHPVLLLHGLAGHMGEWDDLVRRLLDDGHRVVTYDARGHGASTRRPPTISREACVADAVALIEELSLSPATLIGQSLGGHTAMLLAAAHPALVKSLILIEAGPGAPAPDLPSQIAAWLDSWPTPFRSPAAAQAFFGHAAWAANLEERKEQEGREERKEREEQEDGWYPRVDRDTMIAAVTELAARDYWDDWTRITCPALVIRGADGTMSERDHRDMRARRPTGPTRPTRTTLVVVPAAAHDVHLDQPERLHAAVRSFLTTDAPTDVSEDVSEDVSDEQRANRD